MKPGAKPNIVLIVLDSARAANFSCYGHHRETSPNVDRIASEGVLFEQCISPACWTLPTHASLFTGMYPSGHCCNGKNQFFNPNLTTLPQVLQEKGYRTLGVSCNVYVSGPFGFTRGFDRFFNAWQLMQSDSFVSGVGMPTSAAKYLKMLKSIITGGNPAVDFMNCLYRKFGWRRYDLGARRVMRIVQKLAEQEMRADSPFFLFVNLMEAHQPYAVLPRRFFHKFLPSGVSEEEAKAVAKKTDFIAVSLGLQTLSRQAVDIFQSLYDGCVSYADHCVGQIYNLLKNRGMLDNTILVVTSDHGQLLGEHGVLGHYQCLYDELIWVPLIARCPEIFGKQTRKTGFVQWPDIFPTILEILGLEKGDSIQGESLLRNSGRSFAVSEQSHPHTPVETWKSKYPGGNFQRFKGDLFSFRTEDWKLIQRSEGQDELYCLADDPRETKNLAGAVPEVEGRLRQEAEEWKSAHRDGQPGGGEAVLSEEIKSMLQSLGYM